jgi:hypothetical protein
MKPKPDPIGDNPGARSGTWAELLATAEESLDQLGHLAATPVR